jgi:hypothetical protein
MNEEQHSRNLEQQHYGMTNCVVCVLKVLINFGHVMFV